MVWKINDHTTDIKGYIRITDSEGKTVADMFPFAGVGGVGVDDARKNARKIVNSDQLYDALNGLMDWVKEGCPDGGQYAMTEAEAAVKNIIKTEGRRPTSKLMGIVPWNQQKK